MQEFGQKIGWARGGLFVSALLLVVMGILCFVAHDIMPEPMHNTGLPEGLTTGGIIGAIVMAVLAIVEITAYVKGGGSESMSGFFFLSGVFAAICCVAVLVDPLVGTLSYEWVIAVLIGIYGVILFIETLAAGRLIKYSGWALEAILGLVMVVLALGVVYDSSYASVMAGLAFFVLAVETALKGLMINSIKPLGAAA